MRLCKEHFIEFFEKRVKRTVERYKMIEPSDRVAVAVSGGKDSVSLLYVLRKLSQVMGFKLVGIHVNLGIGEYSKRALDLVLRAFKSMDIEYFVVSLKDEYGFSVEELVKKFRRRTACSLCGTVKRYILNKIAYEARATKLATGHNLDDFAEKIIMNMFRGSYEQLAKLSPTLPSLHERMIAKIKPLAETPERDVKLYVQLNNISFLKIKCPFSQEALSLELKSLLDSFERNHPGAKISLVRHFFKRMHPVLQEIFQIQTPIKTCKICGFPSSHDLCSFCKIRMRVLQNSPKKSDPQH
ncbi:MAG: TIGR00269 family protein [Thermoprotei archaeon]|nr:MAG: TIGR00269 family protein [Thermoprotei archaeon]